MLGASAIIRGVLPADIYFSGTRVLLKSRGLHTKNRLFSVVLFDTKIHLNDSKFYADFRTSDWLSWLAARSLKGQVLGSKPGWVR